ncbi:MAG TPA: hypothetical protein VM889_11305 [Candidatus Thermoplasmatota archaeon]|nr:hypothetical protein [Candidatus Thermoplasmatota archaeon]
MSRLRSLRALALVLLVLLPALAPSAAAGVPRAPVVRVLDAWMDRAEAAVDAHAAAASDNLSAHRAQLAFGRARAEAGDAAGVHAVLAAVLPDLAYKRAFAEAKRSGDARGHLLNASRALSADAEANLTAARAAFVAAETTVKTTLGVEYLHLAARAYVAGSHYRESLETYERELAGYFRYDVDTEAFQRNARGVVTVPLAAAVASALARDLAAAALEIDPLGKRAVAPGALAWANERLVRRLLESPVSGPHQGTFLEAGAREANAGARLLAAAEYFSYVEVNAFESLSFKSSRGTLTPADAARDARVLHNATAGLAATLAHHGVDGLVLASALPMTRSAFGARPDFNAVAAETGQLRMAAENAIWIQELSTGEVKVNPSSVPIASVAIAALGVAAILGVAGLLVVRRRG